MNFGKLKWHMVVVVTVAVGAILYTWYQPLKKVTSDTFAINGRSHHFSKDTIANANQVILQRFVPNPLEECWQVGTPATNDMQESFRQTFEQFQLQQGPHPTAAYARAALQLGFRLCLASSQYHETVGTMGVLWDSSVLLLMDNSNLVALKNKIPHELEHVFQTHLYRIPLVPPRKVPFMSLFLWQLARENAAVAVEAVFTQERNTQGDFQVFQAFDDEYNRSQDLSMALAEAFLQAMHGNSNYYQTVILKRYRHAFATKIPGLTQFVQNEIDPEAEPLSAHEIKVFGHSLLTGGYLHQPKHLKQLQHMLEQYHLFAKMHCGSIDHIVNIHRLANWAIPPLLQQRLERCRTNLFRRPVEFD